jgi:hypothetical protein
MVPGTRKRQKVRIVRVENTNRSRKERFFNTLLLICLLNYFGYFSFVSLEWIVSFEGTWYLQFDNVHERCLTIGFHQVHGDRFLVPISIGTWYCLCTQFITKLHRRSDDGPVPKSHFILLTYNT